MDVMKKLTTALLFIITVGAAGYAVRTPQTGLAILIAAGGTLFFVSNPKVLLITLVCVGVSNLRLPGVGGRLSVENAVFALVIGYGFIRSALARDRRRPFDLCERGLFVFSLAVALAIEAHGFGLSLFGGNVYGGMAYVSVFLAIIGYKAAQKITLNARQARMLVYCFVAAASLPFFSQISIYLSPALYSMLNRIMDTKAGYLGDTMSMGGEFSVSEQVRFQGAAAFSAALWLIAMAKFSLIPKKTKLLYVSFGALTLLTALGGFRSATANRIAVSVIALVVVSRSRVRTLAALAGFAVAGYLLLFAVGPQLPVGVQRALSFLPGIDWDVGMLKEAAGSVNWRLEVWKLCWQRVPQHLLIGRGLLIENVAEHAWLGAQYYGSPEFLFASHGYHSGPLALLLDTGLLGLAGFLMFQIGLVRKALHYFRASAGSSNLFLRGYLLGQAILIPYGVFTYYFIFGDIRETLPRLIITGILIRVVGEALLKEKTEAGVPEGGRQWAGVGRQVSGVVRTAQQLTTNNRPAANRRG